jgi:pectin methylesterase-like acyl-CoA thioesterase
MQRLLTTWVVLMLISTITKAANNYNFIVAQDGSGNFTTLQAAIDSAPSGLTKPFKIFIKNGRYRERVRIPAAKPFIQLIGESVANTIITYNSAAKDTMDGRPLGTPGSSTFFVYAADFFAMNITFENTFGDGSQAVAASVYGDRSVFINCRFLGNQDTLLTYKNGGPATRQYYNNCYIDGNVDFIFGNSIVLFDSCIIYAKTRSKAGSSFITAANTPAGQQYGYVFRNCILPANTGGTSYFLGRPWQNSSGIGTIPKSHTKVVFINTTMSNSIRPEGWTKWDTATNTSLIYYGEYKSKYFNGALVDTSERADWSYQLTDAEASSYTTTALFREWNPQTIYKEVKNDAKAIAISNFKVKRASLYWKFSWNISWPMNKLLFTLYKSVDNKNFKAVNSVMASRDSIFNFELSDKVQEQNVTYYYYLKASHKRNASHTTDTWKISGDKISLVSSL